MQRNKKKEKPPNEVPFMVKQNTLWEKRHFANLMNSEDHKDFYSLI